MNIHTVSDNLLNRYEIAYILIEKYIAFLIKQTPFFSKSYYNFEFRTPY